MNDDINKVNNIIKSTEILEEKMCSICRITEKEALSKSLKLVKMCDLMNEKCSQEFNLKLSSISPETTKYYICTKCIEITNKAVEKVLNKISEKDELNKNLDKLKNDIESFEDYISSTAHLFKLNNIIVMQSCYNLLITGIKEMSERDPEFSKGLIKIAIIELERELQKLK